MFATFFMRLCWTTLSAQTLPSLCPQNLIEVSDVNLNIKICFLQNCKQLYASSNQILWSNLEEVYEKVSARLNLASCCTFEQYFLYLFADVPKSWKRGLKLAIKFWLMSNYLFCFGILFKTAEFVLDVWVLSLMLKNFLEEI